MILDARTALRELVLTAGLEVFTEMLEDDRAAICGPKHQPMPDRRAYRHGHDEGRLVFGGRKSRVKKPRIRSIEGEEIELETWRRMANEIRCGIASSSRSCWGSANGATSGVSSRCRRVCRRVGLADRA